MTLPMGVPGPTRQRMSLSWRLSITASLACGTNGTHVCVHCALCRASFRPTRFRPVRFRSRLRFEDQWIQLDRLTQEAAAIVTAKDPDEWSFADGAFRPYPHPSPWRWRGELSRC